MAQTIKKKRMFGVYATEEELLVLKKAALQSGTTLTNFVLSAAMDKVKVGTDDESAIGIKKE
jgi:uncharacterized protein (DUF1778 family)